jgi:hypothetical protein
MSRWQIMLEVWPHSTGNGSNVDQIAAGERAPFFYVDADDIRGALKMAPCICQGIKHNPAVWEAPIHAIYKTKD